MCGFLLQDLSDGQVIVNVKLKNIVENYLVEYLLEMFFIVSCVKSVSEVYIIALFYCDQLRSTCYNLFLLQWTDLLEAI